MTAPTRYVSFLLRLWSEEIPDMTMLAADWQSEIEHIQTGRRWYFHTLDELLEFLGRLPADPNMLNQPPIIPDA